MEASSITEPAAPPPKPEDFIAYPVQYAPMELVDLIKRMTVTVKRYVVLLQ